MEPTTEAIKFNQETLRQIIEMNRLIAEMNAEIVKMLAYPVNLLFGSAVSIGQADIERMQQTIGRVP